MIEDFDIKISPNDHPIVDSLRETGLWEPKTTRFIKENLKEGQTFLDIGASVGYYTLIASRLVGPKGKVFSFEPSKESLDLLDKNISANNASNVKVFPFALSDSNSDSKLYKGKAPGQNSLSGEGEFEEIRSVVFDELEEKIIPDFIKIDVEGHQLRVLKGMEKTLNTKREICVIVEDYSGEALEWLSERGFKIITTEREAGNYIMVKNQKRIKAEKEPITFHLLGTYNTPTNKKEGVGYAFCTKIMHISKALRSLGHKVIFYGAEGSEVECDEFVQVLAKDELPKEVFAKKRTYVENINHPANLLMNKRCIEEIKKRKSKYFYSRDILLVPTGLYQKEVADKVGMSLVVELGIGYLGVFAKNRIFESYGWMNWHYGKARETNGHFSDAVIPPIFDPADFKYREKKDDYFLYIGRITEKKGVLIAKDTCEAIGAKLKVAGIDCGLKIDSPNVEMVGFADIEKRKELISRAKGVFMPTIYLEPFGYVVMECAMSGTPIITTDWGSFPGIVKDGITGYRCRHLADFVWAAKNIGKIKPKDCRKWAMNFTQEKIAPMYERYFQQLQDTYGKGWYSLRTSKDNITLKK